MNPSNYRAVFCKPENKLGACEPDFCQAKAELALAYHKTFPQYQPTPLTSLPCLANELGVGGLFVKDESYRFGLNAFKVLGGSYAIGQVLAKRYGLSGSDLSYQNLLNAAQNDQPQTFVTATDGNHGRGVAWTAHTLGHKAVVYMPEGSAAERLANIQKTGAEASITDMGYDDVVRYAQRMAEQHGWTIVQDTTWEGYIDIPTNIMQGYLTMALEAYRQLDGQRPTHIFLQAGVGSMAAALASFFMDVYRDAPPRVIVVEPNKADCFYRTALAGDGELHCVTEKMDTIMAGLACGEPSPVAWRILHRCSDAFISCPDEAAAKGMRVLSSPAGSDPRVVAGESGASAFGLAMQALTQPALHGLKEQLGLNEQSKLLFVNTEGATYQENYRAVVWDGRYVSE